MIEVGTVRAKGCNFEIKSVLDHDNDAEVRADGVGMRKNRLNDIRRRVGGLFEAGAAAL